MKSKSILSLVEVLLFLLTVGIVNTDTTSTSASKTNIIGVPGAS